MNKDKLMRFKDNTNTLLIRTMHHLKKLREISLTDVKMSRFGAENLTKCGNFLNLPYYMHLI